MTVSRAYDSRGRKPAQVPSGQISVITPIFNEQDNLVELEQKLYAALEGLGRPFEVIAVNDGSTDRSREVLRDIAERRATFKVIHLTRNHGQTSATMAGIDHSRGEVIVIIDADLQNDPEDIKLLLDKMDEGHDVVSGWRRDRKDSPVRRVLVSRIANKVISFVSGVDLHDFGCTLKVYRRDMLSGGQRLYGEMHRFIPIYASWMGAKVTEIPISHRPRMSGRSSYGLERVLKVTLDLLVVTFLQRFLPKPIYLFGGFGLIVLFLSFLASAYMLILKFVQGVSFILTPLPLLAAMCFLMGTFSILLGLVAEILVRTYFESQQRPAYHIQELINFDSSDE